MDHDRRSSELTLVWTGVFCNLYHRLCYWMAIHILVDTLLFRSRRIIFLCTEGAKFLRLVLSVTKILSANPKRILICTSSLSFIMSLYLTILALLFPAPYVQASGLDNFSNNLATDIGPLLALFGESVTIQYLSESTSYLDYFIFGMVPIGIITALVSVIRVCGSPSLRAFVGRAQEGDGAVEAELCTSTSRDVGELFNKGGITRVLGRPKVLEIIHVPRADRGSDSVGDLYLFSDYLSGLSKKSLSKEIEWVEVDPTTTRAWAKPIRAIWSAFVGKERRKNGETAQVPEHREEGEAEGFPKQGQGKDATELLSSNPSISLNVGIVKPPMWVFWLVAVLGLTLQIGLVVMAGTLCWREQWTPDGPPDPASITNLKTAFHANKNPLLYAVGTALLCSGMCSSAALIGQSTRERIFRRKPNWGVPDGYVSFYEQRPRSRLFWLQPGNQVVGDQTFDAYGYSEQTGMKSEYMTSRMDKNPKSNVYTWVVAIITLGGYVVQFIGLRGMNAWISIAQLGATLFMSFLRGCLRMQRLDRSSNLVGEIPDKIIGHELDWLAMRIGKECVKNVSPKHRIPLWSRILGGRQKDEVEKVEWFWYLTERTSSTRRASKSKTEINYPEILLGYRSQLSMLTGLGEPYDNTHPQTWAPDQIPIRRRVPGLLKAICSTLDTLIGQGDTSQRKNTYIEISLSSTDGKLNETELCLLSFRVDLPNWNLNPQKIEGILGLWLWSLKHDKRLETGDGHGNKISVADKIQKARIIGMVQLLGFEDWGRLFERWLDRPGRLEGRTLDLYIPEDDITDPRTIWQDTCPCVPAESETIDKTLPENLIRFGGWGNVAHYALKDLVKVRAIFVEEPLDLFCTVELFCTVLRAILEDNSIQLGEPAPIEKEGRLGWENEKVSKVLSAFVDGMLGTHYNAMCLIPILTGHVWVPKGRFLLSALLKSSIQYQQKQEWQRAEAMLKDACLDYQSSPIEGIRGLQEALSHNATITDLHKFTRYLRFEECLSAVVALGELYLSALWCAPSNRILEKFGTSGIRWMQQNLTKEAERANRWKLPQRRDTLDDPPIYTMHADRDPSYGALIESIILTYTLNACELLGSHQDVRRPGKEGWMAWRPKSAYQDSSLDTANISYPLSYREERNRLSQARFLISSSSQIALSPSVPYDELILSAVEHSSPEVLAWILERTKDFHIKDDEIQAAIQRCLEKDDAVIFKVFLDYGVNFEHFEQTFGHYHSTDVFWLLLDLGVDMNWGTILLSCIESNWLEAVASLLRKRKTYPDRENSDKRTALLIASEQGNLAMVNRLLREKHFHPNVEDNEGFTALERAAEKGHVSVVDRLLDVPGIELRWKADNKCKPLVIMAVGHIVEYPKILTKLLQPDMIWKIDKTYVHSDGRSLLSYAAEKGLETAVKDLLNQKEKNKAFNPDLQDDYGRTPLSYAAAAGNEKIVDMLLEVSEVNPNSTDVEGRTPAVWAESNGHNGIALKIAERIN